MGEPRYDWRKHYTVAREGGVTIDEQYGPWFDHQNPQNIFWPPDVAPPEMYYTPSGKFVQFKKLQINVPATVDEIARGLVAPRVWYQRGEEGSGDKEEHYDLYLYHDFGQPAKVISWGSTVQLCGRVIRDETPQYWGNETFKFYDSSSVNTLTLKVFFDPEGAKLEKGIINRDVLLEAARQKSFVEIFAYVVFINAKETKQRFTRLTLMKARHLPEEQGRSWPDFCAMLTGSYVRNDPEALKAAIAEQEEKKRKWKEEVTKWRSN